MKAGVAHGLAITMSDNRAEEQQEGHLGETPTEGLRMLQTLLGVLCDCVVLC